MEIFLNLSIKFISAARIAAGVNDEGKQESCVATKKEKLNWINHIRETELSLRMFNVQLNWREAFRLVAGKKRKKVFLCSSQKNIRVDGRKQAFLLDLTREFCWALNTI